MERDSKVTERLSEGVRLLHCADLHLGSALSGLGRRARERREELYKAFERILALCVTERVELLLIAGDLFDTPYVDKTLAARVRAALAAIPNTVVLIAPGNHDPACAGSVYDQTEEAWPENVFIFGEQLQAVVLPAYGVRVWGAGFTESEQRVSLWNADRVRRVCAGLETDETVVQKLMTAPETAAETAQAVTEAAIQGLTTAPETAAETAAETAKAVTEAAIQGLTTAPETAQAVTEAAIQGLLAALETETDTTAQAVMQPAAHPATPFAELCVLHGVLMGRETDGKSVYHPISLRQLEESGITYAALGHIHKRTPIQREGRLSYAYAGCPEGRGYDETGLLGCYLGTVGQAGCALSFVPICARRFERVTVDLSGLATEKEAAAQVLTRLREEYGAEYERNYYDLILTGAYERDGGPSTVRLLSELSDLHMVRLHDQTRPKLNLTELAAEPSLKGVFVRKLLERAEAGEDCDMPLRYGLRAFTDELETEL